MNELLIFVVALFLARFDASNIRVVTENIRVAAENIRVAVENIRVAVENVRATFAGSMPQALPAVSSRKPSRAKGRTR